MDSSLLRAPKGPAANKRINDKTAAAAAKMQYRTLDLITSVMQLREERGRSRAFLSPVQHLRAVPAEIFRRLQGREVGHL
jgi:hypothetical protein